MRSLVPSRFVSLAHQPDGSMLIFSSRTGAFGRVSADDAVAARTALQPGAIVDEPNENPILDELATAGFFVESHEAEQRLVDRQYVSKYDESSLNLILMPTEQCNFRCVYCYETFARPAMSAAIQEATYRFVASQTSLRTLDINWFGGEPLLASSVVLDLSRRLQSLAHKVGTRFTAAMTTNGFLLTKSLLESLVDVGVSRYQVTLDGLRSDHDCRRPLAGGGSTFDTILANLRDIRTSAADFTIMLRHNFDPGSLPSLENYLDELATDFAADPRFVTFFHAVGRWGGPNDQALEVCDGRTKAHELLRAQQLAAARGFVDGVMVDQFRPDGFQCYAANPRSFVIGADGAVYKCTVELDSNERNIVGRLHPSGSMELDWAKMGLWCETNGRAPGKKCVSCHFSPACHGAACPKEWLDSQGKDCECPPHKQMIRDALPLLQIQSRLRRSAAASAAGPTSG